jgi:hypothetical protein
MTAARASPADICMTAPTAINAMIDRQVLKRFLIMTEIQ